MHEHPKFVLLAKFVLFRLKVRFIVQKTFVSLLTKDDYKKRRSKNVLSIDQTNRKRSNIRTVLGYRVR